MKTKIDQWEAFIAVAKEKNYKKASDELQISTPMLSRKIQDLEKDLNTRLFHRTTRSVELTQEGHELRHQAQELIEHFYKLEEYSNQMSDGPLHGDIKITAPRNFADLIFPKVIAKFNKLHPHVNIDINFTDDFVNLVEERIDLAIRMGNIPNSTMIGKKITDNKLTICASPTYLKENNPIQKPEDLKNHPLLYLDSHKDLKFKLKNSKKSIKVEDIGVKRNFKSNSGGALTQMALNHGGVAIRCYWDVKELLESKKLISILEDYPLDSFHSAWIVYPSKENISARVRELIQFLEKELRQILN